MISSFRYFFKAINEAVADPNMTATYVSYLQSKVASSKETTVAFVPVPEGVP